MEKVRNFLTLLSGWALAVALGVLWFLNSRRRNVPATPHIEPQKVPESDEAVLEAARREGLIR